MPGAVAQQVRAAQEADLWVLCDMPKIDSAWCAGPLTLCASCGPEQNKTRKALGELSYDQAAQLDPDYRRQHPGVRPPPLSGLSYVPWCGADLAWTWAQGAEGAQRRAERATRAAASRQQAEQQRAATSLAASYAQLAASGRPAFAPAARLQLQSAPSLPPQQQQQQQQPQQSMVVRQGLPGPAQLQQQQPLQQQLSVLARHGWPGPAQPQLQLLQPQLPHMPVSARVQQLPLAAPQLQLQLPGWSPGPLVGVQHRAPSQQQSAGAAMLGLSAVQGAAAAAALSAALLAAPPVAMPGRQAAQHAGPPPVTIVRGKDGYMFMAVPDMEPDTSCVPSYSSRLLEGRGQFRDMSALERTLDWLTSPALLKSAGAAFEPEELSVFRVAWQLYDGVRAAVSCWTKVLPLISEVASLQAASRKRCRQIFAAVAAASSSEQHTAPGRAPTGAPAATAAAGLSFLASLHRGRATDAADRAGTTDHQTGPETLWVTLPDLHVSLLRLLHEADSAALAQGTGLSQAVRCAGHTCLLCFGSECTACLCCVLSNGQQSALDLQSSLQTRVLCVRSGGVVCRVASWLDLGPVQVGLDAAADAERAQPGAHQDTLRTYAALLAARHGALCVLHLGIRCGFTVTRCAMGSASCWSHHWCDLLELYFVLAVCSRRQPCTGPLRQRCYLQPCTSASCPDNLAECLIVNRCAAGQPPSTCSACCRSCPGLQSRCRPASRRCRLPAPLWTPGATWTTPSTAS